MVFKWNKTLSQIYGHRKQMAFRFCIESSLHAHDENTMGHGTSRRQLQIYVSFLYSDPEDNLKGLLLCKAIPQWRNSFEKIYTQNNSVIFYLFHCIKIRITNIFFLLFTTQSVLKLKSHAKIDSGRYIIYIFIYTGC